MHIRISISDQSLTLLDEKKLIKQYSISTAKNGPGEEMDSECTPRGVHIITEKIGEGSKPNSIFVGRIQTGEIYEPALRELHPERDWILTRIFWLSGTEEEKNKGGNVDSHDRFIYIHGSPDDVEMGQPGSHGCVRMRNEDIIELFEIVEVGIKVVITAE
ncbi:MAG: L,D-transpeptidase [Proteobacteria bacterium]|nr:L,D-transpeptidase [Pseudomonadota bacterium]